MGFKNSRQFGISSPAMLAALVFAAAPAEAVDAPSDQSSALGEILVTAEKREERLQDVPIPITVLGADTLVENNQLRLADYYSSVPGLTLTTSSFGLPSIEIRGLSTGGGTITNPTVAVTVDDLPYGGSTPSSGGSIVPDLDPGDLANVEVLRGPQGTLYGASSLGGLLKFNTVDPSTQAVSGRVQADVNNVYNGEGLGYAVRGAVNVPLSDTFAIRASSFSREDPGYIDNILTGARGVNKQDAYGGRLAALWKPSDALSVKLGAFVQKNTSDGLNGVTPEVGIGLWPNFSPTRIGPLQQIAIPGAGVSDRLYQVYSAHLTAKIGSVDLTAISGYSINSLKDSYDVSYGGLSGLAQQDYGVSGVAFTENNTTKKFTQEIRATMAIAEKIDWLVGVFYTHEASPYDQIFLAEDIPTGAIAGTGLCFCWKDTYQEYSAFTDFTVHFTDRFDVQLGGRESRMQQSYTEVDTGPWVIDVDAAPSPYNYGLRESNASAFTYLVTPRFKFSQDVMAYVRLASGYRPGGPQALPALDNVPNSYKSDRTENYEIGIKGDFLDHSLSFDGSVYYINWTDIQLTGVTPNTGLGYLTNGSKAKSQGVELSGQARPGAGLVIGGWVAINEAKLTAALLPGSGEIGESGDRLPDSARFSGNVSLDEEFSLGGNVMGFTGGTESYVGNREGLFPYSYAGAPARAYAPAYAKLDLHAGVRFDSWKISAFANNVANKLGVLQNDSYPYYIFLIQPRTIGLSAVKSF